jgi:hypothetical protein
MVVLVKSGIDVIVVSSSLFVCLIDSGRNICARF